MFIYFSYVVASAFTTGLLWSIPNRSTRFRLVAVSLTLAIGAFVASLTEIALLGLLDRIYMHEGMISVDSDTRNLYIASFSQLVPLGLMVAVAYCLRRRVGRQYHWQ